MRDRGSMTMLVVLVGFALTAALAAGMTPVLIDLVDRQRARSAADAAALAGVTGGRAAAHDLAEANGGSLVGWAGDRHAVTVRVQVGDQVVVARASDAP